MISSAIYPSSALGPAARSAMHRLPDARMRRFGMDMYGPEKNQRRR